MRVRPLELPGPTVCGVCDEVVSTRVLHTYMRRLPCGHDVFKLAQRLLTVWPCSLWFRGVTTCLGKAAIHPCKEIPSA